jgi:alkaline phosphatase
MKKMTLVSTLAAATALQLVLPSVSFADPVKNIIVMVPDGMGLADVTAARIYKNGLDGAPLSFETLEHIGYQRTYSLNSTITDSAPAASAWACGEKFNNGEICLHGDGRPHKPSILELAKEHGKATALVATSTITHATPASFGAHVVNRNCENEIARQYIEVTGVDLLLGAGTGKFNAAKADACGTIGNFTLEAQGKGYVYATTQAELDAAVAAGNRRILGLFAGDGGMTPEYVRAPSTTEPHLAEMATAALKVLERNRHGFFAMIEGSQVDWANHANSYDYQLGEMLAFDDAVTVVRNWIDADEDRKQNTLLIVVADHDTGGFAINGPQTALLKAGEKVEAGWTTTNHTGVDTLIWSQGPGSSALTKALDNTNLYGVMVDALRGEK